MSSSRKEYHRWIMATIVESGNRRFWGWHELCFMTFVLLLFFLRTWNQNFFRFCVGKFSSLPKVARSNTSLTTNVPPISIQGHNCQEQDDLSTQLVPPMTIVETLQKRPPNIQVKGHFIFILCRANKMFPLHLWCQPYLKQSTHLTLTCFAPQG